MIFATRCTILVLHHHISFASVGDVDAISEKHLFPRSNPLLLDISDCCRCSTSCGIEQPPFAEAMSNYYLYLIKIWVSRS